MREEYKVKGIAVRTKFDYVRENHGKSAEEALKSGLVQYRSHMPLLDSSWYPFAFYDDVIRAIATRFFSGHLTGLREVGVYSAQQALTTVYKSFARSGSVAEFFKRIGSVHSTYYNLGEMRDEADPAGNGCTVLLSGAPVYSEADQEISVGFFLGACRLLGKPEARCSVRTANGGVRYELRW
jgi:hypothetical protein